LMDLIPEAEFHWEFSHTPHMKHLTKNRNYSQKDLM